MVTEITSVEVSTWSAGIPVTLAKANPLVTSTGVMLEYPASAMTFLSKTTRGWPAVTVSPALTLTSNPLPPSSTVSTPTWMSSSTPLSSFSPKAWPESGAVTTVPSAGA